MLHFRARYVEYAGPMLTANERAALIRTLTDAGDRIANCATLVKTRESDRETAAMLKSAMAKIEHAIQRIALWEEGVHPNSARRKK